MPSRPEEILEKLKEEVAKAGPTKNWAKVAIYDWKQTQNVLYGQCAEGKSPKVEEKALHEIRLAVIPDVCPPPWRTGRNCMLSA